jgi:uncharacterized protein YbbK (DUF523 family)/uncharacterized protein YbgA (DUF1722 family)
MPKAENRTLMKTATRFPRPIVVVSRCLCGARCRWDGDSSPSDFVKELRQYARIVPVCPELEIGLGVPRDRIVLLRRRQGVELYQPTTRRRLAQKMNSFTRRLLTQCGEVDGFILKHKSTSCGLRGVKLYASAAPDAAFVRKGVGMFAAETIRLQPHAVFGDEERLADPNRREQFLTRLFTLAAFHAAIKRGRITSLRRFHEHHRLALGVCNRRLTDEMDRLVSCTPPNGWDSEKTKKTHPLSGVQKQAFDQYETLLFQILQKPPRRISTIKPFELSLEHYAPFLGSSERSRFRRQMKAYFAGDLTLAELRKTVQVWAVRYDKNFIRRHSFFRPYPGPLAEV